MTNYHNGVVILNYNSEEDTVKCIDSIRKYTVDPEMLRIYVVDNASPDGSGERLEERYRGDNNIIVIMSDKNGGFSYGNNLGLDSAIKEGCKNVFVLNSDVMLLNDAISVMAYELDNREDIAVVGPRIYSKEGNDIQFARKALTWKDHMIERLPGISDRQVRRYRYIKESDYCFDGMTSGCCFGIKLECFKDDKLFDDNIFMYYEEDVMAYKIKKIAKKTLICSKAKVLHNEASSTKKSVTNKEVFERFNRWISALYVLSEYSGASALQIRLLKYKNILEWKALSLIKSEYSNKYKEFVEKNN